MGGRQAGRQTDRQTDKQTDRQTFLVLQPHTQLSQCAITQLVTEFEEGRGCNVQTKYHVACTAQSSF